MVETKKTDSRTTVQGAKDYSLNRSAKVLRDEVRRIIARAQSEHREALTELEGMSILAAMGVRTPRYWLVQSAKEFLEKIGAKGA
nr:hypothetical protein [Rectinema sp.]